MKISEREVAELAVGVYGAMQKPAELAALLRCLDEELIVTSLEIGLGKGGTSWGLSKLNHLSHMIAIDLPAGPWSGSSPEDAAKVEESLKVIAKRISDMSGVKYDLAFGSSMNSQALEAVKGTLGEKKLDLLFIDGDHSYAGVKTDFLTYSPLVRSGGFIVFHDICAHPPETGCEVEKFWKELKEGLKKEKFVEIITEPITWGGIGVIEVE